MGGTIYPAPRMRDAAAAAAGSPASNELAASLSANARNWPFVMREISGCAVAVSPQFVGPAIIKDIVIGIGRGGAAVFATMQVYASDDNSGGGSNLAGTFVPTGEALFDQLTSQRDDGVTATDANGITLHNLQESVGYQYFPIRRVTRKSKFFLKIRLNESAAVSIFVQGYINLLENVAEEDIRNFL